MSTPKATVVVVYEDGESDSVTIRPIGLIAAERRYGEKLPPIEGSLYAAYYQLRAAGSPRAAKEFEDWLSTLDAVEAEEGASAHPTEADAAPLP